MTVTDPLRDHAVTDDAYAGIPASIAQEVERLSRKLSLRWWEELYETAYEWDATEGKNVRLLVARVRKLDRLRAEDSASEQPKAARRDEVPDPAPSQEPEAADGRQGGGGAIGEVRRRAEAVADALASLAATHPSVARFRRRYLGGRTLADREVDQFVSSPAVRFFTGRELADAGVPFPSHTAGIVEEGTGHEMSGGKLRRWITVRVTPPGVELSTEYTAQRSLLSYGDGSAASSGALPELDIDWPRRPGPSAPYPIAPGSVAAELGAYAKELARAYLWDEPQAQNFVLTGARPWPSPVRSTMERRAHVGVITLRILPWVPPEAIGTIYRRCQREMLRKVPARWRDVSDGAFELFRFVTSRAPQLLGRFNDDEMATRASGWEDLRRDWNRARRDRRFRTRDAFWHAFRRVRDVLLPELAPPRYDPSPYWDEDAG